MLNGALDAAEEIAGNEVKDNVKPWTCTFPIIFKVLQYVTGYNSSMLLHHYQEVQESVSNIVDVGLRQGPQAAAQAQAVAQAAPQHFEEKGNFAAGLTKTVEETGGLLTGVIKKYNIFENQC